MPIIVGTEEAVSQYARSYDRREKLNNLGLVTFVVGVIFFGLVSTKIIISDFINGIGSLMIIIGFILAYFTKLERDALHRWGIYFSAIGFGLIIITNFLNLTIVSMMAGVCTLLIGIGVAVTT